MITRKFIETIHYYFDNLNYHITGNLNYTNFIKQSFLTMSHCNEFDEVTQLIDMFNYCYLNWSKIVSLFNNKLQIYNQYKYEGCSFKSVNIKKETPGEYYFTDGLLFNKEINFIFDDKDENYHSEINRRRDKFYIFDDSEMYLKNLNSKIKIFDKQSKCILELSAGKNFDILVKFNATNYAFVKKDSLITIYSKKYIESLNNLDNIDDDKCLAAICYDIFDENDKRVLTKLEVYSENVDSEICCLVAIAPIFLIPYMIGQSESKIRRHRFFRFMLLMGASRRRRG